MSGQNSDCGASSAWPGAATGQRIVILGAASTAIDFYEAAQASGNEVLGFLEDDVGLGGQGLPVLGPLKFWKQLPEEVKFFFAIGSVSSHRNRLGMLAGLGIPEHRYATIIHPKAVISPSAIIGPGCGILALSTLGCRVHLGAHVEILQLCIVAHDCDLEGGVILAGGANLAGGVVVGQWHT